MPPSKRVPTILPPGTGEVISELFKPMAPLAPVAIKPAGKSIRRFRRAGTFAVPVSLTGSPRPEREALAKRFKSHLKGTSGNHTTRDDPDETVNTVPASHRKAPRPGLGLQTRSSSRFGGFTPSDDSDDDDE